MQDDEGELTKVSSYSAMGVNGDTAMGKRLKGEAAQKLEHRDRGV